MVRETSSRDRYRKLKRDITAKLTYERFTLPTAGVGKTPSYRAALTKATLLPLTAVALPTIRESSDTAKRTLSDPQTFRTWSLTGPSPPACCRAGRSVRPLLRPCVTALPIRSWNSDDSNSLASCDVTCKSEVTKRARLCRNARVDYTTSAVVNIPIIISSPDDCDSQLVSRNESTELSSSQRRSSCPFTAYDSRETSSSGRLSSLTSRKRRCDASRRRPSLQLITATAIDEQPESCPAASTDDRRETARVNGECHSSSLDVHWSSRRLSLPHPSTSVTDTGSLATSSATGGCRSTNASQLLCTH